MSAAARSRPLRIVHCPALVGGHAGGLARAERELGLDSRVVAFDPPPFGYAADEVLFPAGTTRAAREIRRWRFLLRVLRESDVVHLNFGSTILPRFTPGQQGAARALFGLYARLVQSRDLALLRRRGVGIVVTFQGDDARQGGPRFDRVLGPGYFDDRLDRAKRAWIAALDRYADALYALNPDLLEVLPARAEFLPYASLDPRECTPAPPRTDGAPVVVHAPTDRRVKGTRHLLDAVERLRSEGVALELVLVEGVPHAEARRAFERADVFVDQLLTGWYGGAAVEAMALGKPVVAHVDEGDIARVPQAMRAELPIVRADRTSVYETLRELLTARRPELPELGRRSRAFVERWHDPRTIAARLREVYERSARRRPITTTSTNAPST